MQPEQVDLLLRHGYILTIDPQRRILTDGSISIRGDRIVAVGPADAYETIDAMAAEFEAMVGPSRFASRPLVT